jgi:hypothetical protein
VLACAVHPRAQINKRYRRAFSKKHSRVLSVNFDPPPCNSPPPIRRKHQRQLIHRLEGGATVLIPTLAIRGGGGYIPHDCVDPQAPRLVGDGGADGLGAHVDDAAGAVREGGT